MDFLDMKPHSLVQTYEPTRHNFSDLIRYVLHKDCLKYRCPYIRWQDNIKKHLK